MTKDDAAEDKAPTLGAGARKQPSLIPGVVLLALAAILIVIVLINPDMAIWLRRTIGTVAICVVVALLGYAIWIFTTTTKRGGGR